MTSAPPPHERFARRETLRNPADYRLCYREGARRHGEWSTLHARPNPAGHGRLGITASRKVGGAVVRNRLKRWTRETYRRWPRRAELGGLDLVVHLKPGAAGAVHREYARELERLLAGALAAPRRKERP